MTHESRSWRSPIILVCVLIVVYIANLWGSLLADGTVFSKYFFSGVTFQLLLLLGSGIYINIFTHTISFDSITPDQIWNVLFFFTITVFFVFFASTAIGTSTQSSIPLVSLSTLLAIVSVVLAPFSEEVFFRGLLFSDLDSEIQTVYAIVLSSLVFTGGHILVLVEQADISSGIASLFFVFVSGMLFAKVYSITNNILVSIVSHSVYNIILI